MLNGGVPGGKTLQLQKIKIFIAVALLAGFGSLNAQEIQELTDSVAHHHFVDIISVHRDRSYITAGGGFGNLAPLMFEGRLSPGFLITLRHKNRAILLNPQVTVRMEHRRSFPVNSPSYKAKLFYFQGIDSWKDTFMKKIFYNQALWYADISHFSNGGGESFYSNSADRIVDFDKGSFSTDYATLGITTYQTKRVANGMSAFRVARASFEGHFPNSTTSEMQKVYGQYRFYVTWKSGGLLNDTQGAWLKKWRQHSGIEIQTGWIAGKMTDISSADVNKRWMLDISYGYSPRWFKEISFFTRFYRGQDYYNIYFVNTIHMLSFGITANMMNPEQVVKTIGKK